MLLLPRATSLRDQSFPFRTRRPQQPISLISAYIHGVRYAARSSHISNIGTTSTSAQTVIEGSRNHSHNQGNSPTSYERSQCAHHAVIEIRMTRTVNEASPDVYALKEEKKGG